MYDIDQIVDHVSKTYSELTKECKKDLKDLSKVSSFEKGTLLVKEGHFANKSYFIVSGCARTFYIKEDKDVTDWFAFENDFISSINSFFLNVPSPLYIELLEPSIILEISRENMVNLSEKHHDFERLGSRVLTKTLLQLQQRVVSIQFETAKQRYQNLLKVRPDITLRVPLSHIASYLGITLETLSRIRNPKNGI